MTSRPHRPGGGPLPTRRPAARSPRRSSALASALSTAALGTLLSVPLVSIGAHAAPVGPALTRPALTVRAPAAAVLQAAAHAGPRWVAVGERGLVVLSDDQGGHWRQVAVPVSVGLTAVRFVDADHGWIVGHGGVVLASRDGGQTWALQLEGRRAAALVQQDAQASGDARLIADAERLVADGPDKPLLDLHFFDRQHGIVVGAYNLALVTADGGQTWQPIGRRLDNPRGLHLYSVRARGDELLLAGEQGLVLHSTDRGEHFQRLTTPYKGSFFTGEIPAAGELVVAGLRGTTWRSRDAGASWTALPSPVPVNITASALDDQGRLWFANQAGMVLTPAGDTLVPAATHLPPLNGLLPLGSGQALGLSVRGAVPVPLKPAEGAPK